MRKASDLFAERLTAAIESKQIRVKAKFCKRAGIGRNQLDNYADGTTEPLIDTAQRIAKELGLTLSQMVADEPPPRPHTPEECLARAMAHLATLEPESPEEIAFSALVVRALRRR